LFFLGYASTNTYPTASNLIGDNTFLCGTQKMDIPITIFEFGQFNFKIKIICNDNITWSINGSLLILTADQILSRKCSQIDNQKLSLSFPQLTSFNNTQILNLRQNLAALSSIDISRVNVTQRPNDENKIKNGELVISIAKANGTDETEHSSVLYNFVSNYSDTQTLKNFLSNASINANDVNINTLTFNETVGTTKGCTLPPVGGLFTLLVGSLSNCTPTTNTPTNTLTTNTINTTTSTSTSTSGGSSSQAQDFSTTILPLIIGITCGVIVSVIITVAIIMIIPGTRKAIFPTQKIRSSIKKKAMPSSDSGSE